MEVSLVVFVNTVSVRCNKVNGWRLGTAIVYGEVSGVSLLDRAEPIPSPVSQLTTQWKALRIHREALNHYASDTADGHICTNYTFIDSRAVSYTT